jgi:GTP cyclohydrolase I
MDNAPTSAAPDHERMERAVRELLAAVGEDPDRDGLLDTPARVARMLAETLAGIHEDPRRHLTTTFEAGHDEIVLVCDIPFSSTCEHHMVPFLGQAHVGYLPGEDGRITGLSKIARLVDGYARRLQVQERLTTQIAVALETVLEPRGVIVVLEAEHMCMSIRGVRKPGVNTITSAVRGVFRDDVRARTEALSLINAPHRR